MSLLRLLDATFRGEEGGGVDHGCELQGSGGCDDVNVLLALCLLLLHVLCRSSKEVKSEQGEDTNERAPRHKENRVK